MRQINFIISLFFALTLSIGQVWGATTGSATLTYSSLSIANQTSVAGTAYPVGDYFNATCTKNSASTNPTYYTSGTAVRCYATKNTSNGNIITITQSDAGAAAKAYITKVTYTGTHSKKGTTSFTYSGSPSSSDATCASYSADSKVTSASATLCETGNSANGQFYLTGVTVEYVYTPSTTPTCTTPTFNPEDGETFSESIEVTISAESGATIYYTTNGDNPTTSSNVYSSALTFTETTTLKAIAVKTGSNNSAVASATYTKVITVPGYAIDFENELDAYTDWTFDKLSSRYTITAHGGSYYGGNANSVTATSGTTTATITTKEKVATPGILTFYISKETNNTTASNWVAQVSADGSSWTDVESFDAKGMTKGEWKECVAELSDYTNVYVRISYGSSGAIRAIDDIELAKASSVSKPSITGEDDFLTSTEITMTCSTTGAAIYYTTNESLKATPSTSSWTAYNSASKPTFNETTKIYAAAIKDDEWSAVASQTFTKATILTPTEALSIINGWSSNNTSTENYYVAGIISKIDEVNVNSYATYYISVDGTTTNQLQVYKGKWIDGANFTSAKQIIEGDEVTIKGKLKKYNSYKELDQNNEVVLYFLKARLTWSAASYTASLSGGNTFPTLTNTNGVTVTYSSSNTSVASFTDPSDYSTLKLNAAGTDVTITATFAGNSEYKANTATYTLNVEAAAVERGTITFNVDGGDAIDPIVDATELPDPLPTPTKAGKNFVKWYTNSGKTVEAIAGTTITEDITLYAKWRDPYTVTEALAIIDGYSDNGESATDVYVAGKVCTAPTSLISGGYLTYYISADGTETSRLQVYKNKKLNNEAFTAVDDVQELDEVIIVGKLKKFKSNNNIIPEINTPNYLYSHVQPTNAVTGVTLSETASVRVGNTITLTATIAPTNATNKNVSWSIISGSSYASVSDAGVVTGLDEGEAVVQVETEDGNFTATCSVTVKAAAPTFDNSSYEWQLVTDEAQLVAGKYYVIASDAKGKVASTISSDVLGTESAVFADGTIAYNAFGNEKTADASNAVVFELGGTSGAWTFSEAVEESGLLGFKDNKKVQWGGDATTWTIAIADDNKATIVPTDAVSYHILYNVNSPRFTVYSSDPAANMLLPQLYVWALKTYKLRYDANGGSDAPAAQVADDEGKATVTSNVPTAPENKVFDNWNTLANGTGDTKAAGDVIDLSSADVTLFAQWRDPLTFQISYDANGGILIDGKNALESENVTEGVPYTVKANVYEKEDKIFTGWKVGDETYTAGDEIYPSADMTFVAQWSDPNITDFVLVTDVKQLKDGDKIYIVAADYNAAMGGQGNNIRNSVDIAKSNSHIITQNTEPVELTLHKNGDNYMFQAADGYLYAAGTATSGKNYINTKATSDNDCKWTITIDAEGNAEVKSVNNTNTPYLRYNSSQPRFTCYSSSTSQKSVSFYKRPDYDRAITAGRYGTICLPKAGKIYGAVLFEIACYKSESQKIYFDEILDGTMEAGMPYLFLPEEGSSKLGVYFFDVTAADAVVQNHNGLYGSYNQSLIEPNADNYILYSNQYYLVNSEAYVGENRAYIKLTEVPGVAAAPAPGRRRVAMSVNGKQVATSVIDAEMTDQPMKVIMDNKLYIIRAGKMYDATGTIVK